MDNEFLIALGKRIRNLRLEKGWSQEKLAGVSGFHRTYIGMIERGERNMSIKNVKTISDCFNLDIHEFLKLE